MANENIVLEITSAQLDYLIELTVQDVALSLMTFNRLEHPALKASLQLRVNAKRILLNKLKAKQYETIKDVPTNRS